MRIHLSEIADGEGKIALANVQKEDRNKQKESEGSGAQALENTPGAGIKKDFKRRFPDSPICRKCDLQHPSTWAPCDVPKCGRCHPGEREECYILHPKLKRPYSPWRSKERLRKNQNDQPHGAPSVGNYSSGLRGSNFSSGHASMLHLSLASLPGLNRDTLIKDSGSNDFIFNDKKWFISLNKLPIPFTTIVGDGYEVNIEWEGTAVIDIYREDGSTSPINFVGAQYSPNAPCNLISEGRLREDGAIFDPWNDKLIIKTSGEELAKVHWKNNICIIPAVIPSNQPIQRVVLSSLNFQTMHKRLMHPSKEVVLKACRDAGIQLASGDENFHCEACFLGKLTDIISREAPPELTGPGQLIRADLVFHEVGHLGYKYFVHFIDT